MKHCHILFNYPSIYLCFPTYELHQISTSVSIYGILFISCTIQSQDEGIQM